MNLGGIYQDLGEINSALSSSIKSIQLKPLNNIGAYNNLSLSLQCQRRGQGFKPENLIEKIDTELRKMNVPGINNKKIKAQDVDDFIEKALEIAKPLEDVLKTTYTQIYHRTRKIEPNCNNLMEFFDQHNSIAQKCHSCYKVQIEVRSLDELLTLNFLMKSLYLELNNTRKCMVELRGAAKGFYKGLIYCTRIDEAKDILKQAKNHIFEMSSIRPTFSVKRGCTEFTNTHKEYGEIGNLDNLHEGVQQQKEWKTKEEQFFSRKNDATKANVMGLEFNLGELLILKNWILYALAMEDTAAMTKYKSLNYQNKYILNAIDLKKKSANEKAIG